MLILYFNSLKGQNIFKENSVVITTGGINMNLNIT